MKKIYCKDKSFSVLSEDAKTYLIYFSQPFFTFIWLIKVYICLFCGNCKKTVKRILWLVKSRWKNICKKWILNVLESADKTKHDLFHICIFSFFRSLIALIARKDGVHFIRTLCISIDVSCILNKKFSFCMMKR